MKQAVIYTRFSPRPNAGESMSCEFQERKCRDYCEYRDLDVLSVYRDRGLSGKRADNRPGLQKALVQVCQVRGVLVVYDLFRLARSTKDAIIIAEMLKKKHVDLALITQQIDTSTPMGMAFYQVAAVFGELERKTTAERTRVALKHRQDKGFRVSRRTPYGYMLDPDNPKKIIKDRKTGNIVTIPCRIIPNPDEQVIVNVIVSLHKQGRRIVEILHYLQDNDIMPRKGTKLWQHSTIGKIIKRYA